MVFLLSVIKPRKPRHAGYPNLVVNCSTRMPNVKCNPQIIFQTTYRCLNGPLCKRSRVEEQVSALCCGVWLKDPALEGCNGSGRLERPVGPLKLIKTLCQKILVYTITVICTVMDLLLLEMHTKSFSCYLCLRTSGS